MKDKLLILDADTSVYACCFIAEKKMHYAIKDGKVVFQTDDKRKYNAWFKEQPLEMQQTIVYDVVEDLLPFSECQIAIDTQIKDLMKL